MKLIPNCALFPTLYSSVKWKDFNHWIACEAKIKNSQEELGSYSIQYREIERVSEEILGLVMSWVDGIFIAKVYWWV